MSGQDSGVGGAMAEGRRQNACELRAVQGSTQQSLSSTRDHGPTSFFRTRATSAATSAVRRCA